MVRSNLWVQKDKGQSYIGAETLSHGNVNSITEPLKSRGRKSRAEVRGEREETGWYTASSCISAPPLATVGGIG